MQMQNSSYFSTLPSSTLTGVRHCLSEDFLRDGLDTYTGKHRQVISDPDVARAFGVRRFKVIEMASSLFDEPHVVVVRDGRVYHVDLESHRARIVRIVKTLIEEGEGRILDVVCRGALDGNSKPILAISLPLVYKALFGVELTQQQKLDLGIVIRDYIPEVKGRPKVLTIQNVTKEPIWILHYKLEELPKIVDRMLSLNGYY